ncbi:MAG: hypothetical protein WC867_03635 [Candidatus Pacearchaeota archaeon]|jgi:hypothetical protein
MEELDLDNIGNTYKIKPKLRYVSPQGIVTVGPDVAAVKVYSNMEYPWTRYIDDGDSFKEFIRNELKEGKIDRKNGLGFAIFSDEVLNLSMFGDEFDSVLIPNIYFIKKDPDRPGYYNFKTRQDYIGTGCLWEAKDIINFETDSYIKNVLYTGGSREGKERFLEERLSGITSNFPYCSEEDKQKVDLAYLGFEKRIIVPLALSRINKLGDLLELSEKDLRDFESIGKGMTKGILKRLSELGYSLKKT